MTGDVIRNLQPNTNTSMRRESRENRERTRRCNPGLAQARSTICQEATDHAMHDWEGWQKGESQKTCLDVSRTVFGVKIMCGLMFPLIPSLPVKAGDFLFSAEKNE
jgi:hypothetical protein